MIGVIIAAGDGKRLGNPSKALTKVAGKFLVEYPLKNMLDLGIKNVVIIQNEKDIETELQYNWNGIAIDYVTQVKKKGTAHAIYLAKKLCEGEDVVVILGDIVSDMDLKPMMKKFYELKYNCLVGAMSISDKELIKKSYGIYHSGKFIEKPTAVYNLANILGLGFFMFDKTLFETIKITPKNKIKKEHDIIDTLNKFKNKGYFLLEGKYTNINTPQELEEVTNGK
jgi:bifunctional UDP-N-acetylglucosamine pyrophosphorylase/glucosamine-1-phosphate N-acetyltransferase